jgi:hypothetical protein
MSSSNSTPWNNPKARINEFEQAARRAAFSAVGKLDTWAAENPYQAAATGAVVGVAAAVVFNKVLVIKGAAAVVSCAYSAAKGAAAGYAYPGVRAQVIGTFSKSADGMTKAREAAAKAYAGATSCAGGACRRAQSLFGRLQTAVS